MDYETKIYLDKLIEAVDKLNSPDWWTISLTIINTIAVIIIACVQIRIQIKQNKLARYNENIELYNNVKKIHWYIQYIFMDVNFTLENLTHHKNDFEKNISIYNDLRKWLMENETNLRFHIQMNDAEYYGYINFICQLDKLASKMNEYVNQKDVINIEKESKSIRWIIEDDARISTILSHIDKEDLQSIKDLLFETKKAKDYVLKHSILDRLKKLCTL